MCRESEAAREITLFLGLTLLFSAAVYVPIVREGADDRVRSSLEGLLMLAPGLAAIVTYLVCEHTLRPVGWRPGSPRFLLLGLAPPVVYCSIEYGLVWLTGNGGYDGKFSIGFGGSLLLLLVPGSLSAALEEIGWRGLLVPNLMRLHAFNPLVTDTGGTWLLVGEEGGLTAMVGVVLAVLFWLLRSALPREAASRMAR